MDINSATLFSPSRTNSKIYATQKTATHKQIQIISKGFTPKRKKREYLVEMEKDTKKISKGLKIYTKEEQKQTCVAMRATVST